MPDTKSSDREGSGPRPPDDADRLLIQLAEQTQRRDSTALGRAHALARLVALSKARGKTQKQVAEDINFTESRLSKYLALAKAPEDVQKVSSEDGLQDLDLLHTLKKAYDEDPKATTALLTQWRRGPGRVPLRPQVDKLRGKAPPPASAIKILFTDTDPRLIVEVGQKQVSYSLPPHTFEQLHNLTGKRR